MSLNFIKRPSLKSAFVIGCAAAALVATSIVTDVAFAANQGAGQQAKGANAGASGGDGHGAGGQGSGAQKRGGSQGLGSIFKDITGMNDADASDDDGPEDSDRPEWSGQPGGKDGAGGGQPATSSSKKGDLFGDLWIVLRDANGVPLLTAEGWVQPLDADGNLIALDEEGHPVDESLTQEVELGRLNVGRAPTSVLDKRASEVITLLSSATDISTDAAGRLVLTVDGVAKTIDSPLENLAIYVALMTDGSIPELGVNDVVGTDYDFLVDGVYTAEDLAASTVFLAAATDKTGVFTPDEIAYINAFLDINTVTDGTATYSVVDYSNFSYDRSDTYGDSTATILVEQPDGSFVATEVNIFDAVFGSVDASAAGDLDAYTLAADDSRAVVNYIHEFEVPVMPVSQ